MKWKKRFCLLFTVPSIISKNLSVLYFQPVQMTISQLRACTKRKYVLVCAYLHQDANELLYILLESEATSDLTWKVLVGGWVPGCLLFKPISISIQFQSNKFSIIYSISKLYNPSRRCYKKHSDTIQFTQYPRNAPAMGASFATQEYETKSMSMDRNWIQE